MEKKGQTQGGDTALQTIPLVQDIEPKVLSAVEMKTQVQAIQQVMEAVMKPGVHYGVIPGTSKKNQRGEELTKPTLLKPGAEKIMMTFRFGADPEITDLSGPDEARYRVKVRIFSILDGRLIGYGIGEASSNETKYKWRAAFGTEYDDAEPDRRKVKHYKNGGSTKQVRQEIADVANTVLKMAKKRALSDGVITATAASDVFDQDLDDLEGDPEDVSGKPPVDQPVSTPQRGSAQASQPTDDPQELTDEKMIESVKSMLEKMGEPQDGARRKKANEIMDQSGLSSVVDYVQAEYDKWKQSNATQRATI